MITADRDIAMPNPAHNARGARLHRQPVQGAPVAAYLIAGAVLLLAVNTTRLAAQPVAVTGGVRFTLHAPGAREVSLVGDFNGWSRFENPMAEGPAGEWTCTQSLKPGVWQYTFFVDRERHVPDPANPATVPNYNNTGLNSVLVRMEDGSVLLASARPLPMVNPGDVYPPAPGKKPVYLNIIWHQHQPLYVDPSSDMLTGPWVRTHATKDYYDMAAMLRHYPQIHCTINLTSSLLLQLQHYYVDRLSPFIDFSSNSMDVRGFLDRWKGKTDPWIDLALKPVEEFSEEDRDLLYRNPWNAFGMSEVMRDRFPELRALWERLPVEGRAPDTLFTPQEQREIIFWFYLAHFDPDFLLGPVVLEDGSVCDLSGFVGQNGDGRFFLKKTISDADRQRIVVEAVKVASNVIPLHRALRYDPVRMTGQVEIITTPYYHPILPLIFDSDLAGISQPHDSLPPRYSYPEDAEAQVTRATRFFGTMFGSPPEGMWPAEGAVAQEILPILRARGIRWTASDVKNLERSRPEGKPNTTPYRFPAGDGPVALVFRDTDLSDRVGFTYQNMVGEESAEDFVRSVLAFAPDHGQPDVLITVILDGENAWEWYRKEIDGKGFLHALYRKLSRLGEQRRIITVTPGEYFAGNPTRGVPPHPVDSLPAVERLWPGSWINANYDTWIGEGEENRAWRYLLRARRDLETSGLPRPDPQMDPPPDGTRARFAYEAWESMYAAEGSDWFWWYGSDQTAPGGEEPFDRAFRTHLSNVYRMAARAGVTIPTPDFPPVLTGDTVRSGVGSAGGTMALGAVKVRTVLFECDTRGRPGTGPVCIAGSIEILGSWTPNSVRMVDDGSSGDRRGNDGIWSFSADIPAGTEVHYKYTRGGTVGRWEPGDESPGRHRTFFVPKGEGQTIVRSDIFGVSKP